MKGREVVGKIARGGRHHAHPLVPSTANSQSLAIAPHHRARLMGKWELHLCLQCPYSRSVYLLMPELQKAFPEYAFEIVLTALPFHLNAWPAMAMAQVDGVDRDAYIKACYSNMDRFKNAATQDMARKEVFAIFADLAKSTGCKLSKEELVERAMGKGQDAAWKEFKVGIIRGVIGTPKHVVDGVLVKTDSEWKTPDYKKMIKERKAAGVRGAAGKVVGVAAGVAAGVALAALLVKAADA